MISPLMAGADAALLQSPMNVLRLSLHPQGIAPNIVTLAGEHLGVAMPLQFRSPGGMLSFISTTTVFGTPLDVTLQELALETFFPSDEFTADVLRALHAKVVSS